MPVYKVIYIDKSPEVYSNPFKYKDEEALTNVANYITGPREKYRIITGGFGVDMRNPASDMIKLAVAYDNYTGLRLRHSILSFSDFEARQLGNNVDEQLAVIDRIAKYAAAYYASDYQIIYGIHPDEGHFHIHFLMNTVNYNTGKKYKGDKGDYYRYKRYLNDFFHQYYGWSVPFVKDQMQS